jgi:hypothetical protein
VDIVDGSELRQRLDRLGRPYTKLAPRLGLSVPALHHQMRGLRRITPRTELLLEYIEREAAPKRGKRAEG